MIFRFGSVNRSQQNLPLLEVYKIYSHAHLAYSFSLSLVESLHENACIPTVARQNLESICPGLVKEWIEKDWVTPPYYNPCVDSYMDS